MKQRAAKGMEINEQWDGSALARKAPAPKAPARKAPARKAPRPPAWAPPRRWLFSALLLRSLLFNTLSK